MMKLTKFLSPLVKTDRVSLQLLKIIKLKSVIFLFSFVFLSCNRPTYPKEKLAESAQRLLEKEANLEGNIKIVENTLYLEVVLPKKEIITEDKKILSKGVKKIEKAVLILTRLALSTDAYIEFLVCIARIKNYDFCIKIINYLQDIKDYLYMKISRNDYEKRIVLEMLPFSKVKFEKLSINEFLARLVASQYNMYIRTNPFAGAVLSNTALEFISIDETEIVFSTTNELDVVIKPLFEEILSNYFLEVQKMYYLNLPKKIKIINQKNEELFSMSF